MSQNFEKSRWFLDGAGYFCIPCAVATDKRLTESELRTLLALALHAIKRDEVWPSRARLVELTGMHKSTISAATNRLESLGWIRKERRGLHGKQYVLLPQTPKEAKD